MRIFSGGLLFIGVSGGVCTKSKFSLTENLFKEGSGFSRFQYNNKKERVYIHIHKKRNKKNCTYSYTEE
jgi:hypothetical protein